MANVTDGDVITTYAKATTTLGMFDRLKEMAEEHEVAMRNEITQYEKRLAYIRQTFANNIIGIIKDTVSQLDSLTVTGDDDDDRDDD